MHVVFCLVTLTNNTDTKYVIISDNAYGFFSDMFNVSGKFRELALVKCTFSHEFGLKLNNLVDVM